MQTSGGVIEPRLESAKSDNLELSPQALWKNFQDRMQANAAYEKELSALASELVSRLPPYLNSQTFLRCLNLTDMNQFLMSVLRAYSNNKGYSPGVVRADQFDIKTQYTLSNAVMEVAKAWQGVMLVDYEKMGEHYIDIKYKLDRPQILSL